MTAGTEHHQIDPASGAILVGGDMFGWSDLPGLRVPAAARQLVAQVLSDPKASVMLVGPTASTLLDELDRSQPVSVLVRGVTDARDLQTRSGLHPELRVYCGGLDRFTAPRQADLVICLDARDRLLTPDSPAMTQADVVRGIVSLARPGGTVLLTIRNPLGLDVLAAPIEADPQDVWHRAGAGFDQWACLPDVPDLLRRADLHQQRLYAAYPSAEDPTVLLAQDAGRETIVRAGLFAEQHAVDHFSRHPTITDAVPLIHRLFRSRNQVTLAPAWLVVGTRDGEDLPEVRAWPELVVAENTGASRWDLLLTETDHELTTRALEATQERRVARDTSSLVGQSLGDGEFLDLALRARCADHDPTGASELVRSYARWLASECPMANRLFATPDNVLCDASGAFTVFDPSWSWLGDVAPDVPLARGLRRFAQRLVASGVEHPWSPNSSPDAITQTLMLAAGATWAEELPQTIAGIEGEIAAAVQGLTAAQEQDVVNLDLERGRNELIALPGVGMGYRQAMRKVAELAQRIKVQDQRIAWLERHLEWRDRQYAMLEKRTNAVQATAGYRVANAIAEPKRRVINGARRTVVSQLPPGFMDRAEKAARKMLKDQ